MSDNFTAARWANAEHGAVLATDAAGEQWAVPADDPRLEGLTVAAYEAPARRVRSVLPVAFRRAARATPFPGGGTVMAALTDGVADDPDARDALEYMVRAERADLLAGGMPAALADAVLGLAATYPGADPTWEPAA